MTEYTELKRLAEGAVHAGDHWGRRDSFERQLAKLVGPEVVLALISKLEQDEMHLRAFSSVAETAIAERNQFKDESERLNTENKQLILLECHGGTAEAAINLLAERDQFKAENEALLAALKGMASMYGFCWDLVDGGLLCMQHNVQRFEDAHAAAQKVLAAIGKGEQS